MRSTKTFLLTLRKTMSIFEYRYRTWVHVTSKNALNVPYNSQAFLYILLSFYTSFLPFFLLSPSLVLFILLLIFFVGKWAVKIQLRYKDEIAQHLKFPLNHIHLSLYTTPRQCARFKSLSLVNYGRWALFSALHLILFKNKILHKLHLKNNFSTDLTFYTQI